VASQMAAAQLEKTEVSIAANTRPEIFVAKGEMLRFDGFMKVYGGGKEDVLLPSLKAGQALIAQSITGTEVFTRPPARYSEATLVRKLEELGIGRPSTYAPTISTIQTRGYVEKTDLEGVERQITEIILKQAKITSRTSSTITGADRAKLIPTGIAEVVTDFLVKYFPSIVDYDFTARVETDFDNIAEGKETWEKMITNFYKDFHPLVEQSADISRQEVSQARELGLDPKTKEPIFARYGRYGPMLQRGNTDDETKKPTFAPLPSGQTIDNVNLEQALTMFELPRLVGKTEDRQEIKANIGRFGPYIQIGKSFVSIKPLDPRTITESEARELYATKQTKDAAKHIKEFPSGIKILNGPYGPYVTDNQKNARIAKDQDPAALTEAQAKALLAAAPTKRGSRRKPQRRTKTKR